MCHYVHVPIKVKFNQKKKKKKEFCWSQLVHMQLIPSPAVERLQPGGFKTREGSRQPSLLVKGTSRGCVSVLRCRYKCTGVMQTLSQRLEKVASDNVVAKRVRKAAGSRNKVAKLATNV